MSLSRLFDLAAPRHGVVDARLRRASGISPSAFARLRRKEELARPYHDVTLLPGHPDGPLQRLSAALAAIGPDCAATGWSAAYLHGLVSAPPTVHEVLAPHGASHRRHEGVHVRETSVWDQVGRTTIHGLSVVGGGQCLADLSPSASLDTLIRFGIELRGRGELANAELDRLVARRKRFPGRGRLRQLAEELRDDGSDSGFELRARRRLEARGTPPDPGQHKLVVAGRRRRIDLPWVDAQVGIECRGFAYHGDRAAFDRDADRHNDFVEDGRWRLLELTWTTFLQGWDGFVARLDRLLGR